MRNIILSTESVADLPKQFIEQYDIQIIPMHVIMEGKGYVENELTVADIFESYERTKKIPTTTSKNSHEYNLFFAKIQETYPNSTIIHIGYTSRASGSFFSATAAAKNFNNIHLIDTLNVTGGLAAIVLYAAELLEQNPTIEPLQFVEKIEEVIPKTKLAFIPNSLEFLKASGRVGSAAYIGGSLLKIKPCVEIKDGKLVPTKKYRGTMSSVSKKLVQDFLAQYNINRNKLYFVYSVGLEESIKDAMNELAKQSGCKEITWIEAGPTISSHAGPGCFGIAGMEY